MRVKWRPSMCVRMHEAHRRVDGGGGEGGRGIGAHAPSPRHVRFPPTSPHFANCSLSLSRSLQIPPWPPTDESITWCAGVKRGGREGWGIFSSGFLLFPRTHGWESRPDTAGTAAATGPGTRGSWTRSYKVLVLVMMMKKMDD